MSSDSVRRPTSPRDGFSNRSGHHASKHKSKPDSASYWKKDTIPHDESSQVSATLEAEDEIQSPESGYSELLAGDESNMAKQATLPGAAAESEQKEANPETEDSADLRASAAAEFDQKEANPETEDSADLRASAAAEFDQKEANPETEDSADLRASAAAGFDQKEANPETEDSADLRASAAAEFDQKEANPETEDSADLRASAAAEFDQEEANPETEDGTDLRAGAPRQPPASTAQEDTAGEQIASRPTEFAHREPGVKVQKVIAAALEGESRRGAEELIASGRVTIDGILAKIGKRVRAEEEIAIDGQPLARPKPGPSRLIAYYKPRGEIVSRNGADSVFSNLPSLVSGRWLNVGRLDVASEGLLLFSDNGDWVNQLVHPSYSLEKEYLVVSPDLIEASIIAEIEENGLICAETSRPIRPCSFVHSAFNEDSGEHHYAIVLAEGRNRIVRRMFDTLDVRINSLLRVRFGDYRMPDLLQPGDWLEVTRAQITSSSPEADAE